MNKHGVDYCMTAYPVEKINFIDVVMRSGDKFFMAEYEKLADSNYFDFHLTDALRKFMKILGEKDEDEEDG